MIRLVGFFQIGMDAIACGRHRVLQLLENFVAAFFAALQFGAPGDRIAAEGVTHVVCGAARFHAAFVREGQTALPGEVEPQHIGKIGTVRAKIRTHGIGAAERIARIVQTKVDRGAARIAKLRDEASVIALVGLRPVVVADDVQRGERRAQGRLLSGRNTDRRSKAHRRRNPTDKPSPIPPHKANGKLPTRRVKHRLRWNSIKAGGYGGPDTFTII